MADKELSAEDLRDKLFHTFRNRGVLDSFKSQLRNRLVTELQQTAKVNLANGKKKPAEETTIFNHAANSLVIDHLEKCNFEYTLSVFLPESGTTKDKLLTVRDLLHLLKIDRDTLFYKSLESSLSSKINPKSFLWEVISQFSAFCGHAKQSTTVQTDETTSFKPPSIAEKLQFVDKAFSQRAEKENESWSSQTEQKRADFQKKCEERMKKELEAEIHRYKAVELSRMRLEEKERCQKEIKTAKEQMEKSYSVKAEMLRLKEKELIERQERQQKMEEETAFAQRQKILEEIQAAKERENDYKRRQELHSKSLQLEEDRIKAEAERVKNRELVLKEEEMRVVQKVDDEIQRYKLQHQENIQRRLHDLELREAQLQQNKESFDQSKSMYLGYYDELEGKKNQLQQSQNQLEAAKYNLATLQQQKDTLLQKLDEVKDYRTVKDRELVLLREKEELQRHLEEHVNNEKADKDTIKDLQEKLSKPFAELISIRNELKAVREDAKNKEKLSKERQKKLESRLQQENQRCIEFQRLYEEHLLRQKEMDRELDDLRAALHHTQTVLRMELERRRASETSITYMNDLAVPNSPADVSPPKPTTAHAPFRARQESETSEMNDTGSTQEMIANSKGVFEKLEKEAKNLEESYRRFQSRMKNNGLDQFTSVPPVSLERHTVHGYPDHHANLLAAQQPSGLGTNLNKEDSQNDFLPLSWLPTTEKSGANMPMSYIASGHMGGSHSQFSQSLLPSFQPSTRDDKNFDSATRFYSLPSFGVSELTHSSAAPRYFGLSGADTRPPNNTVNVSDLIAKPGSPSIISAPIDHSSQGAGNGEKAKERQADSTADTIRRPLSSTIDRDKEGAGSGSRDSMTSVDTQRNDAPHVPVLDGSVFHGRKSDVDKDLSENDSQRSSDASLSGGYLSVRNLGKPVGSLDDSWKKAGRQANKISKEKTKDETSGHSNMSQPMGRASLDDAWGKPYADSAVIPEQSLDRDSTLSMNSNLSLPGMGEHQSLPLDSVWGKNDMERVSEDEKRENEEREKREREEREREKREREKREREKREREKREREKREREEREWEEEKQKREELRRRREDEAWEREQRELAELRELEEHTSKKKPAHRDRAIEEKPNNQNPDEQNKQDLQAKEPAIDPVMLQYMQMIQQKKNDEDNKVKANKVIQSQKTFKEAAETPSNSLSHGEDNLGSIEELTEDDGFDWG